MSYVEGQSREQISMEFCCLNDFIDENNPVRVIDAFVDSLDLEELNFKKAVPANTGRKPYNPGDLLKLYLYGYTNRIRSSRRLEKECKRNIELIWLLNRLAPDFKTIADFRKDNKESFDAAFRHFIMLCKNWDLFSKDIIAVDGSKFKAYNSRNRNLTKSTLEKRIKEIDEKISNYLNELDENDKSEADELDIYDSNISEKIDNLKMRKGVYQEYINILKESGETQISLTDTDSRLMKTYGRYQMSYNVQTSVEDKNKLIIDYDVVNEVSDIKQLSKMAKNSKHILETDELEVLADTGYYSGEELKECVDNDISPYVPYPDNGNPGIEEGFKLRKFKYNFGSDTYKCPVGEILSNNGSFIGHGKNMIRYSNFKACKTCSVKNKCTQSRDGRFIGRWEHQIILDIIDKQTKDNFNKYKKRQQLAEHPFGTLKLAMDCGYFLTKGLDSVKAEMSLAFLAYDFKRVLNILTVQGMLERLAYV